MLRSSTGWERDISEILLSSRRLSRWTEFDYLEECFRISYDAEETSPARHLGLTSAANHNVKSSIKMIQKLNDIG